MTVGRFCNQLLDWRALGKQNSIASTAFEFAPIIPCVVPRRLPTRCVWRVPSLPYLNDLHKICLALRAVDWPQSRAIPNRPRSLVLNNTGVSRAQRFVITCPKFSPRSERKKDHVRLKVSRPGRVRLCHNKKLIHVWASAYEVLAPLQ